MTAPARAMGSPRWWRSHRLGVREVLVALLGVLAGVLLVQVLHTPWWPVLYFLFGGAGSAFLILRRLPEPIPWAASLPLAFLFLGSASALGAGESADLAALVAGVVLVAAATVPTADEASPAPTLTTLQTLLPALAGVMAFLVAISEGPTTTYLPVFLVLALAALTGVVLLFDRVAGTSEEGLEGPGSPSWEAS